MRPRPPGRYLSAEVCGPQTPHLTGSVEKPLTMAEAEAPIQKLLSGRGAIYFLDTGVIFVALVVYSNKLHCHDHLFTDSLKNTEFYKCIRIS